MADGLKKCCQCCCCSGVACQVSCCIDSWHGVEACLLSDLFCGACCWTLCAPLCIDCKCGDTTLAMEHCVKGIKYCVFACALDVVGCCDGIYSCIEVIKQSCDTGLTGFKDITKSSEFIANKVKNALNLETGNEPLKSMGTFTP